jgi:dihydroorotate dehydrogenase (fumarate)
MEDLSCTYLGLKLCSPLIAGSSGLTDNIINIKKFVQYGAGAIVLKSLFEEEIVLEKQAGLSRMSSGSSLYPEAVDFYEFDAGPKESTLEYLDLIRLLKKEIPVPVIASINCQTAEQWTWFPKEIESAGADALELNLFLLPTDLNRTTQSTEQLYFDIIRTVRERISIPLSVKISYYYSNLALFIRQLSETGIQGIVLFNRFYSPDFDIDNMQVTSGFVLSSPGDLALSLRWIAVMSGRVSCDLAASTGVHDAGAMIKQILAGADAVQVTSALYRHGAEHIGKMLSDLQVWMKKHDMKTISDFKGKLSQTNIKNPAAWERVQFMKYFRGYEPDWH